MAKPTRAWYYVAAACVSSLAVGVASIQYANYVDEKSNKQWCQVVLTLDDAYRQSPPQTEAGRKIAQEMARMRRDFDCG